MLRPIHCAALIACTLGTTGDVIAAPPAADYRAPDNPAVVQLLTATPVPTGLFNARAGRVVFIYREALVPVERIARPHFGLAGFMFDPITRTSGYESRVERVVVLDARSGGVVSTWQPPGAPVLDRLDLSPDGRYISAVNFRDSPPQLALFDIDTGKERVLSVAVNPAFGSPCDWVADDALLCRIVPDVTAAAPAPFPAPNVIDHPGAEAPTRTYGNLLENAYEEALFEHYFSSTLARIRVDGQVQRIDSSTGLLARVRPSPDGTKALVVRLQRPYSHLLTAHNFPRRFEIWDTVAGSQIDAPQLLQQHDITATEGRGVPSFAWQPFSQALGWTERLAEGGSRWVALEPPYTGTPREVTHHADGIGTFGWSSAGTPLFSQKTNRGTSLRYFVVGKNAVPRLIWEGATKDVYDNPGTAIHTNGKHGPVLEYQHRVFLSSDGLSADGPQPYLDALDLETLQKQRLITAAPGTYERVVGIVDPKQLTVLTIQESETEPPQLFSVRAGKRTPLGGPYNPYPELDGVERRNVSFRRDDGVELTGLLYLPRGRVPGQPLPNLIWIYPAEFSDEEYAEQIDSRRFRFHQIKEASPIAAVLDGYALLLNPTVPIIGEGEEANDAYIPSLVSSMAAAIDYLVAAGISDRNRIAVAGRSYGAFSTANLLVHTDLFKTGIAISGAYNRTLTPFGFQHEKRSFWDAMDFYTRVSPFYYANKVNEPLLIMHGGADDNPGTPTLQARRFFHALVGNGTRVRYVELPYERHHYRARENVLDASAEMLDWLDDTIGPATDATADGERR